MRALPVSVVVDPSWVDMRAQVVLLRDGQILMARHERDGNPYWVLPGGEVEPGETPEEAARRELAEEAGVTVCINRLLFIDGPKMTAAVTIERPRYTFLGTISSGEAVGPDGPQAGRPGKGTLAAVEWLPFDHPQFDAATRDTVDLVWKALHAGETH